MKKVLIVDFNGTSSVYTHYFSEGLKKEEIQVKILGKKKPEFLDVFSEVNHYLGIKTGAKLFDYICNWLWILFNYKKFDAIIFQWLQLIKYTNIETRLVSYLQTRIPTVYIVHNLYPHNCSDGKVKNNYNLLYKTCKNIAVQTQEIKKEIGQLNPKANIIRINHGLFFKEFKKDVQRSLSTKCLMIGYISKYKGIEDALQVVKKLKDKNVFVTLEIIGLGKQSYIEQLYKQIETLNILDSVTILSKETSTRFLINKINNAAMLWLPYKQISQSGVLYTAIGLGVPIVAYDVGNFKEFFGDKNISEIVEKDNLEQFCSAVIKTIDNNLLYKKNIQKLVVKDFWKENKIILDTIFE